MRLLVLSFFLFISNGLKAQDVEFSLEEQLQYHADIMVNAFEAKHRMRAGEEFHSLFNKYLNSDISPKDLSFIKFISVQSPEDQAFQLISWSVLDEAFKVHHYAYVITPDGANTEFVESSALSESLSFEDLSAEDWYGAVYYRVEKLGDDYLIFGFDGNTEFNNQKVVDVLDFTEEGVVLGKPIFENKEEPDTYKNRLCLSYSSDATVNLNYNKGLEMIVHDHLMPRIGRIPGQGPTHLPDGTYEGYKLESGIWKYNAKLFDHSYGRDNAPRPKPILNTKRESKKKKKSRK